MFCPAGFDQWLTTIMHHLSHLSKPQTTGLAMWSCGMVLARLCALSAVRGLLAAGRQRQEDTVRQQRRAWYDDVKRKRGTKRPGRHVETCFAPLLGWVGRWGQGTQLALALAATTLGQRCVGLAGRVVERGCAIPVAGGLLPAWRRAWRRLRRPAIPHGWTVIGRADRGLYAPWLLRRIPRLGWHPLLRSNTGGSWRPLARLAPRPGTSWRGTGRAWTRNQGAGPWLARWEDGEQAPWRLLTDLPPEASDAGWSGRRAWIEQGLKIPTRVGW